MMERLRMGIAVFGFILTMWGGCAPPPDGPPAYSPGNLGAMGVWCLRSGSSLIRRERRLAQEKKRVTSKPSPQYHPRAFSSAARAKIQNRRAENAQTTSGTWPVRAPGRRDARSQVHPQSAAPHRARCHGRGRLRGSCDNEQRRHSLRQGHVVGIPVRTFKSEWHWPRTGRPHFSEPGRTDYAPTHLANPAPRPSPLASIVITDTGRADFQRAALWGVTVQ
jgi:hypothetical protein